MGLARPLRDSNGDVIKNCFSKESTSGDAFRIDVREPGKMYIEAAAIAPGATVTFTLPFSYQLNMHQLQVFALDNVISGLSQRLYDISSLTAAGLAAAQIYYTELTDTTVEVVNGTANTYYMAFHIPHTSTPGEFTAKVIVASQGDNIGIKLEGQGDGILLTSPNGNQWLLRVDDEGGVSMQEVL